MHEGRGQGAARDERAGSRTKRPFAARARRMSCGRVKQREYARQQLLRGEAEGALIDLGRRGGAPRDRGRSAGRMGARALKGGGVRSPTRSGEAFQAASSPEGASRRRGRMRHALHAARRVGSGRRGLPGGVKRSGQRDPARPGESSGALRSVRAPCSRRCARATGSPSGWSANLKGPSFRAGCGRWAASSSRHSRGRPRAQGLPRIAADTSRRARTGRASEGHGT